MKRTIIIAISFIMYNISSFAAQRMPGVQTCIGTPELRHLFEEMQHKKYIANRQKEIEYYNQYPKISQEKNDQWVAKKMHEIEANKAKYKQQQQGSYQTHSVEIRYTRSFSHKYIMEVFRNDLRAKYYPKYEIITCYPPRLLLEGKK